MNTEKLVRKAERAEQGTYSELNDRAYVQRYLNGEAAALSRLKQRHGRHIYWNVYARHRRFDVAREGVPAVWAKATADDNRLLRQWIAGPDNYSLNILLGRLALALGADEIEDQLTYAPPRCGRGIEALALRLGELHNTSIDMKAVKDLMTNLEREIDRLDTVPVLRPTDRPTDIKIADRLGITPQHVRRVRKAAERRVKAHVEALGKDEPAP